MNNYNFTQSLDGLNNIEADNINTSNLKVGSLVADNAEITTLSDSNLVNCTTSTIASVDNDLVNKKYVVDNFVDRTNNLTQDINGVKTFTTDLTVFNASSPSLFLRTALTGNSYSYIRSGVSLAINNQLPTGNIIFQINGSTRVSLSSTQLLLFNTTFLTTNDMKSRDPTASHSLLSDITTGTLAISSATATNTINGATQLNQQTTFNNFTPISSVATPTAVNHLTRKDYVDNNFVDRTNNLTQDINGLKTFTNSTNFTGSLVAKTNLKMNEIDDKTGNTINLTFPMAAITLLRISSGTNMVVNLPALTANERGMVFTLLKASNVVNVTVYAASGQGIVVATDIATPVASTSTILSSEKVLTRLYVGYYQALTFWVEITEFSTLDRFNLREWRNPTRSNTLTLSFPLPPTIALRASTASTMTITLPTLTDNQRGMIFTFVKVDAFKYDVVFNTSSSQIIFPLNSITGTSTTNSTIFPSTKVITRLAVGWFSTTNYWIEISDYSTFDQAENNLIYPRLAIANTFTNTNIFTAQATFNNFTPISNVATPTAVNHLTRKDYVDNNFVDLTSDQIIGGKKTFTVDITAHNLNVSAGLYILDLINISNPNNSRIFHQGTTLNFQPNANYSNNYYFYCNGYPYVRFSENFTALDCNTSVSTGKLFYTNNISHNNETGTQSIYTGLTSGTINIGSSSSYCNINSLSTFSKLLTVENLDLSYTGDAYINCPNATGLSLFLALTTQTIGLFSNLTTAIVNFCSTSVFTTMFNLNARIKHKQTQILNEVKHITGTSETLTFPLEQTLMLSATGSTSIAITLPLLNSSHHAGFTFNVIKTGSITNSVSFTSSGSNLIRAYGGITGVSSLTQMAGTETIINIYTLEVSAGNYVWALY